MTNTIEQINSLAKSLQKKIPYSQDFDAAHDMIDRIIELSTTKTTDKHLHQLLTWRRGIKNAQVSEYDQGGKWSKLGIPKHQPFGEQIEWCSRRSSTVKISMTIMVDNAEMTQIEVFPISDFLK